MTVLTTRPTAVTVAIPADTFRDEATEHAAQATTAASNAADYLAAARLAAAVLPDTYRTEGGATAAEVIALMVTDAEQVNRNARRARAAAVTADAATNITEAAWAAEDARTARHCAEFDTETLFRYALRLTTAGAAHTAHTAA